MTTNDKDTILLIDSHAIIHRAYHAFPLNIVTSSGETVNAVYGFTKIVLEVLERFKPKYVVAAIDVSGPLIRLEQFADYKGTRKKMDDLLANQIPRVNEVLETMNIPVIGITGYEADDVIGTLVKRLDGQLHKIIVTGDKDIFQLVHDDVKVFMAGTNFSKSQLYDAEGVKERMGFGPEYVIDFKAIKGDPSDNIPGIKGIGDKGAIDLITQFGHLDDIYKHIDEVKPEGLKKKLVEGVELAEMSKSLATIDCEVPLNFKLEDAELEDFDLDKISNLFQELEFRSLIAKLPKSKNVSQTEVVTQPSAGNFTQTSFLEEITSDAPVEVKFTNPNYHILNEKNIEDFLSKLEKVEEFAFDTESTSLRVMEAELIGASFAFDEQAYYLSVELIKGEVKERLKKVFESDLIKKVGHNIKYDMHVLVNFGVDVNGIYFDTMIANYLIKGGVGRNGLKELAFNHLGMTLSDFEALFEKNAKDFDIRTIHQDKLGNYAAADADATWKLYKLFAPKLNSYDDGADWNLKRLFYEVEMPIVKVLFNMEREGIRLDVNYLENFKKTLTDAIEKLRVAIYDSVGHEFNIDSPKQVGEVLFSEIGLPGGKKTKNGGYSTNERILRDLKEAHPVVAMILDFRELAKLNSTYTDALIKEVNSKTGRVHTSYSQAVAATGRLSSNNPNLQNIPVASEIGQEIRKAFVADEGSLFLALDYSQQELRILAHISGDEALKKAYTEGIDVHALTASKIFEKDIKDVTKEERGAGKTINFSVVYGISAFGLSDRLKIERGMAQEFINTYFETYTGVKAYFDSLVQNAAKAGYVETMFGRRRETSGLNSPNFQIRSATQREVINFPIQGTAADQIKRAMIDIDKVVAGTPELKMLLQVHDELVFEVKTDKSPDELLKDEKLSPVIGKIKDIMLNSAKLDVPMEVGVGIGKNWAELKG